MSRTNWRRALVGVTVLTAVVFAVGCGPGTWWHLLKGEETMKAEHPLPLPEGKREVTVAVSVSAAQGVSPGADLDLAAKIGSQMKTLAEANKDTKIVVIDQSRVNSFQASDPGRWSIGNPGEFATKMGADYWIDVTIQSLQLVDRELGGEVCRGKAELEVKVYAAGKAEPKYSYHHSSQAQLKPNDPQQLAAYRNHYLGQVATELAFEHINYKADQKRALEK